MKSFCPHAHLAYRLDVQAEHKLVESAWPTSMRNLLGPNSILTAGKTQHKQQRQILSQVCYPFCCLPALYDLVSVLCSSGQLGRLFWPVMTAIAETAPDLFWLWRILQLA